jgi:hypothetical protein
VKFNGIRSERIKGKRVTQTGCKFAYTNVSTITMTPGGIDGTAQVVLSGTTASNTSTIRSVRLTGSLTCNLSSSGAGGLDTGTKATSKGYYVFVISKQNTAWTDPALLASLSETGPTMPGSYVYRSAPIWFISTDATGPAGDVRKFIETNGTCYYSTNTAILSTGVAYSDWTVVDASALVPNNSRASLHSFCRNKNTNDWNSIRIHFNDDDTVDSTFRTIMHNNVIRHTNGAPGSQQQWEHGFLDAATSLYYKWQNNPGSGGSYPAALHIWCRSWTLS